MNEDIDYWARKNVKCCACGGTLETSEFINICATKKIATWKFPIFGSLDCPGYPPKAVAFVCGECLKNKVKIRHCIEWEGSPYQVKYHDIDSLEDEDKVLSKMKYLFGRKMARAQLVLRAARQEGVN